MIALGDGYYDTVGEWGGDGQTPMIQPEDEVVKKPPQPQYFFESEYDALEPGGGVGS